MTRLFRGRHRRSDLPAMLAALDEALTATDGRIDGGVSARARAVADRAGERLRLSGEHTVVALAGATGSGKSSLFNALAGSDLSPVGVRRPMTSKAHACVWGSEGATPLVQWLGVPRRQTTSRHSDLVAQDQRDLEGLVLLDLPDHDSTAAEHRLEVDRLVELVDLLVWVVDPQKYADAALHERYLRKLAGHDAVTVMVLNQVDTLNPFAAAECADDLRRIVADDGLPRARVLTCSATTGAGLDVLRAVLAETVRRRRARSDRLVADIETVVDEMSACVGAQAPEVVGPDERAQLVEALASSAGVPVVGEAVELSWRRRADEAMGWPPARWVRRLRRDPLRRLHLDAGDRHEVRSIVRSSVPAPTPAQRAGVDTAVRRVCESVSGALPTHWQDAVRRAAGARLRDLRDALDAAVVGTDLNSIRTPLSWRLVGVAQWLLVAAALVGVGWLALLAVDGSLGLPKPPAYKVGALPVPVPMLVGGVLLGLLLSWGGRQVARGRAAARRRRAESRLRAGIEEVAERLVLVPVSEELARHEAAREALERARTG